MNALKAFWNRHGLAGILLAVSIVAVLVFLVVYGERINPWDGKTWGSFQ